MAKKVIHFSGFRFAPNLNPSEMVILGVHGGKIKHPPTAYSPEYNHFGVYPAELPKEIKLPKVYDRMLSNTGSLTYCWYLWYEKFYLGTRSPQDLAMIEVYNKIVNFAYEKVNQNLGQHKLTEAKKYGQLLMEMAINPGFEPTL